MPTRDILFPMISYPTPTETGTVEMAVDLAGTLGAHISGLTFELDIRSPVGLYADPANIGGILAAERAKSAANARDLVAAFDDTAARRNVMHERTVEHCPPIEVGQHLVAHARLRDLTIFPVNTADPGQRSLIEELIFESGRPVLLLPEGATRELPTSLDTVVVAWDYSRPATRAVADALPLLKAAKRSMSSRSSTRSVWRSLAPVWSSASISPATASRWHSRKSTPRAVPSATRSRPMPSNARPICW
jgi:hypothetical protein